MRIRVLMFIEYFHPIIGGAEQQLKLLAEKLAEKDVEVKIFTLHHKGLKKRDLIGSIPVFRKYGILRFIRLPFGEFIRKKLDIPVYRFEDTYADIDRTYWDEDKATQGTYLRTLCLYIYRFYLIITELVKWLILNILMFFTFLRERKNFDIVHCHLMTSPFTSCACRMGRLFKKKVLIKLGDVYDLSVLEKYHLSLLYQKNFKKSVDVFVCIAEDVKKMLLDLGIEPERIIMIPNGVDTVKFSLPTDNEKKSCKERLSLSRNTVVTFVGSLKRKKGLDTLLHSWKDLANENPDLSLILVGREDNHAEELHHIVKKFRLSESVRFEGEVSDVSAHLCASDIFVLPSRSEGMSNAFLEAMSSGLPIISTAVGGAKDAIQNGYNGLLVEPNKIEPLKEAIGRIVRDKALAKKMSENARKTAEEKYSIEKVSGEYLSLYKRLLSSAEERIEDSPDLYR